MEKLSREHLDIAVSNLEKQMGTSIGVRLEVLIFENGYVTFYPTYDSEKLKAIEVVGAMELLKNSLAQDALNVIVESSKQLQEVFNEANKNTAKEGPINSNGPAL